MEKIFNVVVEDVELSSFDDYEKAVKWVEENGLSDTCSIEINFSKCKSTDIFMYDKELVGYRYVLKRVEEGIHLPEIRLVINDDSFNTVMSNTVKEIYNDSVSGLERDGYELPNLNTIKVNVDIDKEALMRRDQVKTLIELADTLEDADNYVEKYTGCKTYSEKIDYLYKFFICKEMMLNVKTSNEETDEERYQKVLITLRNRGK